MVFFMVSDVILFDFGHLLFRTSIQVRLKLHSTASLTGLLIYMQRTGFRFKFTMEMFDSLIECSLLGPICWDWLEAEIPKLSLFTAPLQFSVIFCHTTSTLCFPWTFTISSSIHVSPGALQPWGSATHRLGTAVFSY